MMNKCNIAPHNIVLIVSWKLQTQFKIEGNFHENNIVTFTKEKLKELKLQNKNTSIYLYGTTKLSNRLIIIKTRTFLLLGIKICCLAIYDLTIFLENENIVNKY
jgi:hypothetical protein